MANKYNQKHFYNIVLWNPMMFAAIGNKIYHETESIMSQIRSSGGQTQTIHQVQRKHVLVSTYLNVKL